MRKHEFIARLRWFAANEGRGLPDEYGHPDYAPSRGETTLAVMLAKYLDDPSIPDDRDYSVWITDLPQYIVEAYAEFSSHTKWKAARSAYRVETGWDIPDLVNVHTGGVHRTLVAHSVVRLMPLLAESPWLATRLECAFTAQMEVIDHAWRRFVAVAYRKIMPRIAKESHRGNSGVFGTTTLMTYDIAGRCMFTFQRGTGTMTYVADASDMYGFRSGPASPGAPYWECVSMIEDVIANWDADKLVRRDSVGIGV